MNRWQGWRSLAAAALALAILPGWRSAAAEPFDPRSLAPADLAALQAMLETAHTGAARPLPAARAGRTRLLPGPPADAGNADAGTGGDAAVTVDLCLSTLALVYRRPELCRQLRTDPMDDACLAKLVANGADPALCRAVKSSDLREVCRPDPLQEVRE